MNVERRRKYPDQEKVRELFDYKDGNLIWKVYSNTGYPGKIAGNIENIKKKRFRNNSYGTVSFNGRSYALHILIYIWHHGEIDYSQVIDHIDRDKLNNRIENLRQTTESENMKNRDKWKMPKTKKQSKKRQFEDSLIFFGRNGYLLGHRFLPHELRSIKKAWDKAAEEYKRDMELRKRYYGK